MFLFLCLILIINFLLRQKNLHSYKWEGEKKITIIYAWYSCPLCPVLEMICNGKNMTCVLYMKFNLSVPILIFINLHVLLSSTSPLLIENQVNSECPFFFFSDQNSFTRSKLWPGIFNKGWLSIGGFLTAADARSPDYSFLTSIWVASPTLRWAVPVCRLSLFYLDAEKFHCNQPNLCEKCILLLQIRLGSERKKE